MGFGNFMSRVGKGIGNGIKKAGGKAWEGMKHAGHWINDHKYELAGAAIQGYAMSKGMDASAALGVLSKASKGTRYHENIKRLKHGSRFRIGYSKGDDTGLTGNYIVPRENPQPPAAAPSGINVRTGMGAPTEAGAGYTNIHVQGGPRARVRRT
jgi:hypothetical protein